VLVLVLLALLPVLALVGFAWFGSEGAQLSLGGSGSLQLANTLLLLLAVGVLGAALGTANGWLTTNCCTAVFPASAGCASPRCCPWPRPPICWPPR
jgi:hypothetical protein